jgi:hypothetical protein
VSALDPTQIYLVESLEDPTALLARSARIAGGMVGWDDTSRDRLHHIRSIAGEPDGILIVTQAGFRYRFRPLTLELYRSQVQALVELSPEFSSTEELLRFYRETVF